MRTVCPTPTFQVRSDNWGDGHFGAPRGTLPGGGKKFHDGLDLVVAPGTMIGSMIDGVPEKFEQPYANDDRWRGLQMVNDYVRVEYWYMAPFANIIGVRLHAGDGIGWAQDISEKYGDHATKGRMTPHIHIRVSILPMMALNQHKIWQPGPLYVDPRLFLGE